jgi:hypothetical protein
MQKAFDKKRSLMAADALAAYLDHNEQFNIYADASDFQKAHLLFKKEGWLPISHIS